jgi:uncharacterized protein (DUF1697 family)
MSVLCEAFESLGLSSVATFLGSGNVKFETTARDARTLEYRIRRRLSTVLGRDVPIFIRSLPELKRVAAREAFGDSRVRDASLNVIFLEENLDRRSRAKLMTLKTETDRFRIHGREIYWWRRKKPHTSLFATVPFASVLRGPFTIRSRNTIRRLVTKWEQPSR